MQGYDVLVAEVPECGYLVAEHEFCFMIIWLDLSHSSRWYMYVAASLLVIAKQALAVVA
jgi:hypothetical protein